MDPNNEQAHLRANADQGENFQRQRTRTEGVKYTFCFAFKQQLMRAWQPVPTLTCGIIMFFFFGIVFLGIGIALLAVAGNLMEFTTRYDTIRGCDSTLTPSEFNAISTGPLKSCWVRSDVITIDKEMTGPVFIYYEITNFYQNHRKYFKSKSPEQLRGTKLDKSTAESECDPVILNKHLFTTVSLIDGRALNPEDVAHPCGSMARSMFMGKFAGLTTDFFSLRKIDSAGAETTDTFKISSKGIAWPQDVEYKYKPAPADVVPWFDVTDGSQDSN